MTRISIAIAVALAAGCSGTPPVLPELELSFVARNGVTLERLVQTPAQRACSGRPSAEERGAIEQAARAGVRFPAGDEFLGDWRRGEQIAQSGRGLQYNDPPGAPAGGNCYGCHRLGRTELAQGTLGPSLEGYGDRVGRTPQALRATWVRLYDSHALAACSVMPRFGAGAILSEAQLRDVMALLLDPDSPVNR